MKRSAPGRLFILRPDHLGDLVLFSGALRTIRKQWPGTHITLCVRSYGRQLYALCPHVDRLVAYEELRAASPINRIPQFPGSRHVRQALQELAGGWARRRAEGAFLAGLECDLAVLPMRSPDAEFHWLLRMAPATERLGVSGSTANQSRRADRVARGLYTEQMDVSKLPADMAEMKVTESFLRFMGIEAGAEELWPEFWTSEEDKQAAERLMGSAGGELTLGMAPGVVSRPEKNLPAEWFSAVMEGLKGQAFKVVLLGSAGDAAVCDEVAAALRKNGNVTALVNLAGKTEVRQMIECVRRCDLLITQETAALHIATALRKPVAGIVGGGHFGRFYPWGDASTSRPVHKPMSCYGCNWDCKYPTMRCIQEISPADAAGTLRGLMEMPPAKG